MKDIIENLIEEILKISGNKIVTLVTDHNDVFKIDINENNQFGYSPEHKFLFKEKVTHALQHGGGMIIRQFLSIRTKRKMQNGKEMWIPEKNLYGVSLGNDDWIGMNIQDLKMVCESDAETGAPLNSNEVGTHYREFPIK